MAGRMGGEQVTTKNLTVFAVDVENNLLLIRGSVPRKGSACARVQDRLGDGG